MPTPVTFPPEKLLVWTHVWFENGHNLVTVDPSEQIICPDCGSVAHRLSFLPPDEPVVPGDVVSYRCSGCLERFDIVMGEAAEE